MFFFTCLCAKVALAGTIAGLCRLKWIGLFWLSIFNSALFALNNPYTMVAE